MKKKALIFLLFMFVFNNINSQYDTTFHAIKENTERTAQHTEKGGYEYLSLSVSIFAFFIAGTTLYFSVRTYHSQKRTEKNTLRWPAKQERANLRRIAWSLILSYRKLLAIESILLWKRKFPLPENFKNMKINIEDLHLNEYFGEDIDYNSLFILGDKIKEFNSMMDNRSSQAQALRIPRDKRMYPHELPRYFRNERKAIMELLCSIDKLYPNIFNQSEKQWKNKDESVELTNLKPLFIPDNYTTSYQGCFEVIYESAKDTLTSPIWDMYFSLPFIWIFNLMRNNFLFFNHQNPVKADTIKKLIKDTNFYDIANIYFDCTCPNRDKKIDIEEILTDGKGLMDYNHPYILEGKKQFCQLPLYYNYIQIVLFLIEVDSKEYNLDSIEDIYIIDRVNPEEDFGVINNVKEDKDVGRRKQKKTSKSK